MRNIIEILIDNLARDADFLLDMAGIYPGDPNGSLQVESALLSAAVKHLELVDWVEVEKSCRALLPTVEVTYG